MPSLTNLMGLVEGGEDQGQQILPERSAMSANGIWVITLFQMIVFLMSVQVTNGFFFFPFDVQYVENGAPVSDATIATYTSIAEIK